MKLPPVLTTITNFSKFLALFVFLFLNTAGFLLGMKYQKEITTLETDPRLRIFTTQEECESFVNRKCVPTLCESDPQDVTCASNNQKGWFATRQPAAPVQEDASYMKIQLYYYNKTLDPAFDCLQSAVVPVERSIPASDTVIKDTINLLLQGTITEEEIQQGFATEFPEPGFELLSTSLNNGTLTLTFTEIPSFTSGGSCRVGILRSEVEKTALQFSEVKQVTIIPESVFQP